MGPGLTAYGSAGQSNFVTGYGGNNNMTSDFLLLHAADGGEIRMRMGMMVYSFQINTHSM